MAKKHSCGDPNCDSPFHKGDKVEVMWGDSWIPGIVVVNARTRVGVRFEKPVLYAKEVVTKTVTKRFLRAPKVETDITWEYQVLKEWGFGVAYVRHR